MNLLITLSSVGTDTEKKAHLRQLNLYYIYHGFVFSAINEQVGEWF